MGSVAVAGKPGLGTGCGKQGSPAPSPGPAKAAGASAVSGTGDCGKDVWCGQVYKVLGPGLRGGRECSSDAMVWRPKMQGN